MTFGPTLQARKLESTDHAKSGKHAQLRSACMQTIEMPQMHITLQNRFREVCSIMLLWLNVYIPLPELFQRMLSSRHIIGFIF
jgi:hypothetical protein